MELYAQASAAMSRLMTLQYSTSFGSASRLFAKNIRGNIYNIYGLVRIADEVVDTYLGADANVQLDQLEAETYEALGRQFSANPIVHAFCLTATRYGIGPELIKPFFESMRMDLVARRYTKKTYDLYIYGSAEVVGLMCLRVFCGHDETRYESLREGAARLGAAYQKINFLRDIAADYLQLQRFYFPGSTFDSFDEATKRQVIADIQHDLDVARSAISGLPQNARRAVLLSYRYYELLLKKLDETPADVLKQKRVRVSNLRKFALFASTSLRGIV